MSGRVSTLLHPARSPRTARPRVILGRRTEHPVPEEERSNCQQHGGEDHQCRDQRSPARFSGSGRRGGLDLHVQTEFAHQCPFVSVPDLPVAFRVQRILQHDDSRRLINQPTDLALGQSGLTQLHLGGGRGEPLSIRRSGTFSGTAAAMSAATCRTRSAAACYGRPAKLGRPTKDLQSLVLPNDGDQFVQPFTAGIQGPFRNREGARRIAAGDSDAHRSDVDAHPDSWAH